MSGSAGGVAMVRAVGSTPALRTNELLYVSDEDPSEANLGLMMRITVSFIDGEVIVSNVAPAEPSTIYTRLPVQRPTDPELVPRPSYYPTFAGLSPEQRWVYLNWLQDVTRPINIGFVFIYYYGLERQLLTGKLDLAFAEILSLRQHHESSSFQGYSLKALLYSAIARKRKDLLKQLFTDQHAFTVDNSTLRLVHDSGTDLSARSTAELGLRLSGVNRRYMKERRQEFEDALELVFIERYGRPEFPLGGRFNTASFPRRAEVLFANVSFPSEVRSPALPSFMDFEPFTSEIREVLHAAHERVKGASRRSRT